MAKQAFNNEDPTVELSLRVTVQVRPDKVSLDMRADEGVLYPSTKVFGTSARRAPGGGVWDSLEKALDKAIRQLPEVMAAMEVPDEEW